MIIDGKAIAEEIYLQLEKERRAHSSAPRLGIIVATQDPVIESFIRIKTRAAARLGVEIIRVDLPVDADTDAAIVAVKTLAQEVEGLIVQLPLPTTIDTDAVLESIPPQKDVDACNTDNVIIFSPVALAVAEILARSHIDIKDKSVLIVGHGRLVGKPVEKWFKSQDVEPIIVTDSTSFRQQSHTADIIVLGVGEPCMAKPEDLKEGVVLVDAGTSEAGGKVVGDADPACAEKASLFTPVPGGVGPIAVAMIFKNLFELARR